MSGLLGMRSKHHTKVGPTVLEAWSPSLYGDLDPSIGVERVGLARAWGTSETCVFRGTQMSTLICESSFLRDDTTWLGSSTIVRSET
jgi:hypothetical protein